MSAFTLTEADIAALNKEFNIGQSEAAAETDTEIPTDAIDTRAGIGDSLETQLVDTPSPMQDDAYLRSFESPQDDEWRALQDLTPQEETELDERKAAAFRLNHIGDNPQDEVLDAFKLSEVLGMPIDQTLDNYKTAYDIASEFKPGNMSADYKRLYQRISESNEAALVWRHDFDTAVGISEAVRQRDADAWSNGFDPAMVYGQSEYLRNEQGVGAAIRRVVEKAPYQIAGTFMSIGRELFRSMGSQIVEDGEGNDVHVRIDDLLKAKDWFGGLASDAYSTVREVNKLRPEEQQGRIWDNPELLKNPAYVAEFIGDAAMSFLPMIGAALATGGSAVVGGLVGAAMEAGQMYDELVRDGVDEDTASTWSGVYGAVAGGLDALGLKGILGSGGSFLRRVGRAGAAEGGTEWLQELTQAALESVARGETFQQGIDRVVDAAKNIESFIAGGVLGGAVGIGRARSEIRTEKLRDAWNQAIGSEAITTARNAINNISRDASASQSRLALGEMLNRLANTADTSSTKQKAPEVFEREAPELLPEDARQVWIDTDTIQTLAQSRVAAQQQEQQPQGQSQDTSLNQSAMTDAEVLTEEEFEARSGEALADVLALFGVTSEDFSKARESGAQSVPVDTMRVVSRFEGKERETVLDAVRETPDGMTGAEAKAFDPAKRVGEAVTQMQAERERNVTTAKETKRLRNEYMAAGYPQHVAEYYALLHDAHARAFADRYGFDAVKMLQGVRIERGQDGEAQGDGALNQVGAITPEISAQTGLVAGGIVLEQNAIDHIESVHGEQIRELGYADARDFVNYVLGNVDAVYSGNTPGSLIFVSRISRPGGQVVAALEFRQEGNRYKIITANPIRKKFKQKEKPLWEGARLQPVEADTPGATFSGQSGSGLNLTQSANNVNQLFQPAPPVDSDAFRKWFGDSKVVDAEGKPLVVYHGGPKFDRFNPKKSAMGGIFWFSSDRAYSQEYADNSRDGKGELKELYLSIKNPASRKEYDRLTLSQLQGRGYDGVILSEEGSPATYIAFSPTQIKSVNNRGTWDANDPRVLYQPAYHGSPYRFDKFTLDHIGSGEGAQAFGWGLYFAGSREVSEWYREKLQDDDFFYYKSLDGLYIRTNAGWQFADMGDMDRADFISSEQSDVVALDALVEGSDSNEDAIEIINRRLSDEEISQDIADEAIFFINENEFKRTESGQLYEVDIPENDVLLDWDKPLSEQPESIKKILPDIRGVLLDNGELHEDYSSLARYEERYNKEFPEWTGEELYHALEGTAGEGASFPGVSDETKYDASAAQVSSEYLNTLGIKGIRYLDGTSRAQGEGSHNYVIFDDSAIEVLDTYYSKEGTSVPRGSVTFGPDGRSITRIFKNSDLSTPIHEGAHVFINDLMRVIEDNGVQARLLFEQDVAAIPTDIDAKEQEKQRKVIEARYQKHMRGLEQAKADMRALRENANAQREAHGKAIGREFEEVPLEGALTPEQSRTLQEVNASAFEHYMLTGQAPTEKLRGVFFRIKEWLKKIYQAATVNGVKISPDVAMVFDRMLATDAAIARSKNAQGALGSETAYADAISGQIPPDDLSALEELRNKAEATVQAKIDRKALKDRKERWREYLKMGWDSVNSDPFWKIIEAATGNGVINQGSLAHLFGDAFVENLRSTGIGRRMLRVKGGQSADGFIDNLPAEYLQRNGLDDTDTLWNYLAEQIVTNRRTRRGDAEGFAWRMMQNDDAQADALADEAPGEEYATYLDEVERVTLELAAKQGWRTPEQQKAIARAISVSRDTLRRQVREALESTPLRDIKPNNYARELSRALYDRNEAIKAGNINDALTAIARARLAHEGWRQAQRITEEREAFEKLAKRLGKTKPGSVPDYVNNAIQDVLARFGMMPPRNNGQAAMSLTEVIAKLSEDTDILDVPPAFADRLTGTSEARPYTDLTESEMQDVADLLNFLNRKGRDLVMTNAGSMLRRIHELVDAGARSLAGLKPAKLDSEIGGARSLFRRMITGDIGSLQWQFRKADAFEKGVKAGLHEQEIYYKIVEGESGVVRRMEGLNAELAPVFAQLAGRAREWEKKYGKNLRIVGRDGQPIALPKLISGGKVKHWTSDMVFALALNLGNDSNIARIMRGYPDLNPETVAQLLGDDVAQRLFPDFAPLPGRRSAGLLTKEDWQGIQKVWDTIATQWKDIQAVHERMYGFKPRGVEARELVVNGVTLRGGYYPVQYDSALSTKSAAQQERDDILSRQDSLFAVPAAKRGFTIGRTEGPPAMPVKLSTSVLLQHLNDVTRFIELAEITRFADKVTQSSQWADAYKTAFGNADYMAIRPNLKGLVREEPDPTESLFPMAEKVRPMLIAAGLGWNIKTAILQGTALFPAMGDLGASNVLHGLSATVSGRMNGIREIWKMSPYMQNRAKSIDMDMRKSFKNLDLEKRQRVLKLLGKNVSWDDVVELGMLPLISVDMATSCAIWNAAYRKATVEGTDHAEAVTIADSAVKRVNPDFNPSSRSAFLRSKGMTRLVNMFSSAVVLFAQRRAYNWEAFHQDKKSLAEYLRYEAYDFFVPAVAMFLITTLARGQWGDDDREEYPINFAKGLFGMVAMRVPVAGGIFENLFFDNRIYGINTVFDTPIDIAGRAKSAIKSGDPEKLAWMMGDVLSFVLRVPVTRIARNAQRGFDQWQRGDGTPFSIVMPRPGK